MKQPQRPQQAAHIIGRLSAKLAASSAADTRPLPEQAKAANLGIGTYLKLLHGAGGSIASYEKAGAALGLDIDYVSRKPATQPKPAPTVTAKPADDQEDPEVPFDPPAKTPYDPHKPIKTALTATFTH